MAQTQGVRFAIVQQWEHLVISSQAPTRKREIVPPPPLPEGTAPDWYDDPCGRWEKRYWNGAVWTAHVADTSAKKRGVDAPQTAPGDE